MVAENVPVELEGSHNTDSPTHIFRAMECPVATVISEFSIALSSRGLEYTGHFLLNLLGSVLKGGPDAGDTSKEDYLRAYEAVLEPHHPWIVRKAVHVRRRKETYILY